MTTAIATPAAEVAIDAGLVKTLLQAQHPDLTGRNIELSASGWDNAIFRLGDDLCLRLPRRAASAAHFSGKYKRPATGAAISPSLTTTSTLIWQLACLPTAPQY